jgi:hypothetical protein
MDFAVFNLKDNHKLFKEIVKYQRDNNIDIELLLDKDTYEKYMPKLIHQTLSMDDNLSFNDTDIFNKILNSKNDTQYIFLT